MTMDGINPTLSDEAWAARTFGGVAVGDARRGARLRLVAARLAAQPECSLTRAMGSFAALKAACRLLHHPATTLAAVTAPHRAQTLAAARAAQGVVLLVQDTSEFDFSTHPATTGLGPIGNGGGRGFLVQSVLAICPGATTQQARVLGLAHLEAFDRVPAPRRGERSDELLKRPRESDHWVTAVRAVGAPPADGAWVMVGDRGADIYRLFAACVAHGQALLVRAVHDRRAQDAAGLPTGVVRAMRTASPCGVAHPVAIPARGRRPARTADLHIAWRSFTLTPPAGQRTLPALPLWVVRAWEPQPPDDGEALEWLLLTTTPTETEAAAWERVLWYRHRWVIEEYHQGLKTGCGVEAAQLRDQAALWALLGICAPIAIRLLQLRMMARTDPTAPAAAVLDPRTVAVIAALTNTSPVDMNAATCWRLVARLGGHLGRRSDGPPGWKTLWWGWRRVQTVLVGVQLADTLPPF